MNSTTAVPSHSNNSSGLQTSDNQSPNDGFNNNSKNDTNTGDNNNNNNNNKDPNESKDDSKFAVPHTPNDNKFSFEMSSSNNASNSLKRNSGDNFLHPPTTPSARYSNSFEALNASGAPPRTPERTPQTLLPDGTPLLSPTSYHHSHGLTPGSKRKSIDFYNLLKSPEVRNNALFQQAQSDDPSLKKRSFELHKVINGGSGSGIATSTTLLSKSPERNFIFHDNNHTHNDLTGSPKKHMNISPYRVKKKNDAEIKEISENLKARLNYAALKIQNGWGNKSIEELEKVLEKEKEKEKEANGSGKPLDVSNSTYEAFWKSQEDRLVQPIRISSSSSAAGDNSSPRKSRNKRLSLDEIAHAKLGSAENALVSALSPQKPPHLFNQQQHPSISIDTKNVSSTSTSQPNQTAEQEAIMSLMSLSSPVKKYDNSRDQSNTTSNNQSPMPSPPRLQFSKAVKLENNNDYKLSAPPHLQPPSHNEDDMMVDDDVTDEEEQLSDTESNAIATNHRETSDGLFNNQLTHSRTHSHPNSLIQHSLSHSSNQQPPLPSFSSHPRSRSVTLESPQNLLQLPPLNQTASIGNSKGIKLPPIGSLSSQPQQLGLGLVSQNQDFQNSLHRKNELSSNFDNGGNQDIGKVVGKNGKSGNDDDDAKTASDYSE